MKMLIETPVGSVWAEVGTPIDWLRRDYLRMKRLILQVEHQMPCAWCGNMPHTEDCRAFTTEGKMKELER